MNAAELRIGNYVDPAEPEYAGKYFAVKSGDIKHIEQGERLYKYNPIPLTPELLVKCGFKNNNEGTVKPLENAFWRLPNFSISIGYIVQDEFFECEINEEIIQIKYLHQLQNLYYTLTGKELNIEL